MTDTITYTLPSQDGKSTLHGILVKPERPLAMLEIVHGMAEYTRRYLPLMEFLAEKGILCFGHDHIGHGASVERQEDLGYLPWKTGRNTLIGDILADGARMKHAYPDLPLYLFGHSMGSFLVRLTVSADTARQYAGLIVMGTGGKNPAAGAGLAVEHLITLFCGERHLSPFMEKMMFGTYNDRFEHRTSHDWLSRENGHVDAYLADPLCGFPFTVSALGVLTELTKYANDAKTYGKTPKDLPIRLVSGSMDPVGNYGAGVMEVYNAYRAAGIRDVTCRLYAEDRHELIGEHDCDTVFSELAAWMLYHMNGTV